jgi:hypothetical protein
MMERNLVKQTKKGALGDGNVGIGFLKCQKPNSNEQNSKFQTSLTQEDFVIWCLEFVFLATEL